MRLVPWAISLRLEDGCCVNRPQWSLANSSNWEISVMIDYSMLVFVRIEIVLLYPVVDFISLHFTNQFFVWPSFSYCFFWFLLYAGNCIIRIIYYLLFTTNIMKICSICRNGTFSGKLCNVNRKKEKNMKFRHGSDLRNVVLRDSVGSFLVCWNLNRDHRCKSLSAI